MPPETVTAFGPGRVNLIGEHTDYNDGLSMPFAIERGVTVTATPAERFVVDARDFGERDEFDEPERADGWRAFARGMVAELRAAGFDVHPRTWRSAATCPQGSGLSSSAPRSRPRSALALLGGAPEDLKALAKLCSRVENDWVGAETGLLDQIASLMSRAGPRAADRLPLARRRAAPARPRRLAARDASSPAPPTRTPAPATTSAAPSAARPARRSASPRLRDAHDLGALDGTLLKRARHVVSENARVDATAQALDAHDLAARRRAARRLARLAARRLRGVRPEVEATVERLKAAGAAGARMVGGGFGGSVLALLPPGVARPAGALAVAPRAPARLL